jgi:hypothetical protein
MKPDLLRKHAELKALKAEQEEALDETKRSIKSLEKIILSAMAEAGVTSQTVRINGVELTFTHSPYVYARYAEGKTTVDLVLALKQHKETHTLVKESVRMDSVSAWAREWVAEGNKVPEDLPIEMCQSAKLSVRTKQNTSQSRRAAARM